MGLRPAKADYSRAGAERKTPTRKQLIDLRRRAGLSSVVHDLLGSQDAADAQSALGTDAAYSPAGHTHAGTSVALSSDSWVGSLSGSGVKDTQDLADWIDANVAGGG